MTMIIIKISNRNRQNYHDHNHNHDNEDGHCDNDNDHEMIIIFVMINIEHMCSKKSSIHLSLALTSAFIVMRNSMQDVCPLRAATWIGAVSPLQQHAWEHPPHAVTQTTRFYCPQIWVWLSWSWFDHHDHFHHHQHNDWDNGSTHSCWTLMFTPFVTRNLMHKSCPFSAAKWTGAMPFLQQQAWQHNPKLIPHTA